MKGFLAYAGIIFMDFISNRRRFVNGGKASCRLLNGSVMKMDCIDVLGRNWGDTGEDWWGRLSRRLRPGRKTGFCTFDFSSQMVGIQCLCFYLSWLLWTAVLR